MKSSTVFQGGFLGASAPRLSSAAEQAFELHAMLQGVIWLTVGQRRCNHGNLPTMLQPQQQDLSGSETDEDAAQMDHLRTQPGADTTEEAAAGVKRCMSVAAHML